MEPKLDLSWMTTIAQLLGEHSGPFHPVLRFEGDTAILGFTTDCKGMPDHVKRRLGAMLLEGPPSSE